MPSRTVSNATLNEVAEEYKSVVAELQVEQYEVPLNLAESAEAVLDAYISGSSFDPVFVFREITGSEARPIRSLLSRVERLDSPWVAPLKSTLEYLIQTINDCGSRSPEDITIRTERMYGGIDAAVLSKAVSELEAGVTKTDEVAEYSAEQTQAVISEALDRVGLNDWVVIVHAPMNAMMDVSAEREEIRIRSGSVFSRTAIARLLVHEVGCHVFRSASGSSQPIKLLAFGLGDYLTTEEGLACYQEHKTGLSDPEDSRRLPLRYYAASLSLTHGLFDVYKALREFSDHAQSFETAARAKRGIARTASAGSHLKDKVYFEGIDLIERFVAGGGDLSLLYVGKVSLGSIPLIKGALESGDINVATFGPEKVSELLVSLQ